MKKFYYDELDKFIKTQCEMPRHWCNGEPIPLIARIKPGDAKKRMPCTYYNPKTGCTDPKHPKFRKCRQA